MVKIVSFYIICYEMIISEVKLKLSGAKHGFLKFLKTVDIFYLCQSFKPNPKFECIRKIFSVSLVIKIFVCMLYDKKQAMAISIFHLLFDLVISFIASWVRNAKLAQLDIPTYISAKYYLSGTSHSLLNCSDKRRDKHTITLGASNITLLLWVINMWIKIELPKL